MPPASLPARAVSRAAGSVYADWKGWDPAAFGTFSATDARYFAWHLRRAFGEVPRALRVLEIGYGNGRFMGWLRHQGHEVQGVEADPSLVQAARAAGYAAASSIEELQAAAGHDLVAAFDVLEHVPAPEAERFIMKLASQLHPEGRLLLRFPNGESPFGLWMQHGDLTHVNAWGQSRIRQICVACGLTLEHVGESLPWREQVPKRRVGALLSKAGRSSFEWSLRKMYSLPRGLDLSPNQLVVLSLRR